MPNVPFKLRFLDKPCAAPPLEFELPPALRPYPAAGCLFVSLVMARPVLDEYMFTREEDLPFGFRAEACREPVDLKD